MIQILSQLQRSHQKQALTFMLRREQGWAFDSLNKNIWVKEISADGSGTRYDVLLCAHMKVD
jgi:hypothetical protein